jgi:hypothetical protein
MAVVGRPPKAEGQAVTRHKPQHDWVEVADVPFTGCECGEPGSCERFHIPVPSAKGRLSKATKEWWAAVSTMPHCVLWRPPDWQFALMTARVHALVMAGSESRLQELRVREEKMGCTEDDRKKLHIRYVAVEVAGDAPDGPAPVSDFAAARRRRLIDGD